MENFTSLIMPYVVYMCRTFIIRRVHERFYGLVLKKGNGKHRNLTMEVARLVNHAKGKKLDTHATYIVNSYKEMVSVLFYVDLKTSLLLQYVLALDVNTSS